MTPIFLTRFFAIFLFCPCKPAFASQEFRTLTGKPSSHSSDYHCTFWHEGQGFEARCSNRSLREVPSYLPSDLIILDLTLNKFEILSNKSFVNLPELTTLKLLKNELKHIMKEAFNPLLHLEELFLSYNRLNVLDEGMFSMNLNLRYIDLAYNDFTVIPLTVLNQLRSTPNVNFDANCRRQFRFTGHLLTTINKLYITKNNITRIKANDFTSLSMANIFELKLYSNNVSYIPYGAFQSLKQVKGLELYRNNLRNLTFNSFLGMDALEYLNLDNSKIVKIRGFRFNTTIHIPPLVNLSLSGNRVSYLSEGVFKGLHLLLSLRLRSCRLKSLQNRTFEGLRSLEVLDLSSNSLTFIAEPVLRHVPNLQKLVLFNNKISRLDFQLSVKLQRLTLLDLSANKIAEIPKKFFRVRSLLTLDMSKNLISSLTSGPFSFLSNLTNLILKSNPIRTMSHSSFTGLDNLESLDLKKIGFLEGLSVPFKNLHRLSYLDLSHTSFGIGSKSFEGLTSIRILNLNSADLTPEKLVIGDFPVLSSLTSLQILLLNKNSFGSPFPNTFQGLFQLRELRLTKCGIKFLPTQLFANLSSLEKLYLDRNNILSVTFDHFRYLTFLGFLHLSTNLLSGNLQRDLFRENKKLFVVSFYQNAFTGIEENTFLPMTYFDISQNQLSCTCNLYWFRNVLSQGSITLQNPQTTVCSRQSISQFVGKSILDFDPEKVCGPNLTVYIFASLLIASCILGSVLVWRNRWWLNYKCFHLKLLVVGYYELEDAREHQDYRYDLNIIFPIEDEDWVLEEFLLAVQEHLPDFQRNRIVCGDDDLPLGSTRFDAIDRVIESSFKNLVIVSNASVNDANYLMTLQMTVAHMNDVQLENVVMVFREDIPDNQLPYLVRLFLSKNKPYFQWSEERYQQMLFWEGLAKTLSRNKKMNGLLPL